METFKGNNLGKHLWDAFIKCNQSTGNANKHVVRYGYVNDGLYMKIIEKRFKRKFKRTDHFLLQEYSISEGGKIQITISQDELSTLTLTAVCQQKGRIEKLFESPNIITPRKFVENYNYLSEKLKLNNLLHQLARIGKLDPEFSTILYDFLTRSENTLYALECRMFFVPWNHNYIRICANWANPDSPIFGTIHSHLFVSQVEGEPRNAMVQACAEAAKKMGLDLKTKNVKDLIFSSVGQAGEIDF